MGDYFSCVEDADGNSILEIISLGKILMLNDAAVCGGRMGLKIFVRYSPEMWKSLKS